MKYKIGDKVKLRDELKAGEFYGKARYISIKDRLKNQPLEILNYLDDRAYEVRDVHYNVWVISEEMIEGYWEEPKMKLIDVLIMIAKGELKEGTKVKWGEKEYTYYGEVDLYRLRGAYEVGLWEDMYLGSLNDEVELIEPEQIVENNKLIID